MSFATVYRCISDNQPCSLPHGQVRIEQLFNIIIEYPESEPALVDLKQCLEKINLRTELVTSLKTALETRLLHPGTRRHCC